jgi:cell division protein ZipA
MDKIQLQWLLAIIGIVIVALIYLWSKRARLQDDIRKRQRRSAFANEPKLELAEPPSDLPEEIGEVHEFGELGRVTPDHHLADKILVDVEIRPIQRENGQKSATRSPLEKQPPSPLEPPRNDQEPSVTVLPLSATEVSDPFSNPPTIDATLPPAALPAPKMTVALTVMALRGQLFKGPEIQAAAEEAGLQLTSSGLFERLPADDSLGDGSIFSLAHLRKPGSFNLQSLAELTTPGLLLFMSLPGPLAGIKALDLLVLAADQIARRLGGRICDERHQRLTNQGLLNLRDKVAELDRAFG